MDLCTLHGIEVSFSLINNVRLPKIFRVMRDSLNSSPPFSPSAPQRITVPLFSATPGMVMVANLSLKEKVMPISFKAAMSRVSCVLRYVLPLRTRPQNGSPILTLQWKVSLSISIRGMEMTPDG